MNSIFTDLETRPIVAKYANFGGANNEYRYELGRCWGDVLNRVTFIGLNPSTADDEVDDNTIRRCIRFAKAWGYGGFVMLNIFAFRATDPRDMMRAADPVGELNDLTLTASTTGAGLCVA